MNRQAQIKTSLGDDKLQLQSFHGSEALSRDFEYSAVVLSKDDSIDGNSIVGTRVTVTYFDEDGRQRVFNGMVSRFEYLQQVEEPAKLTSYRLTIVPWLWFLKHNKDCRIFQEKTAPDIIKQIFQDLGFNDFQMKLTESYPEREYCVQYRETDFNLVSRLMEEEGMFYYFEHTNSKHTMVICDSTSGYFDSGESEVRYKPIGQGHVKQLSSWKHTYEFRPGKVAQKDFNFKKPTDALKTDKSSSIGYENSDKLSLYEYPGLYDESGKGQRLIDVRLQEMEAEHETITGSGAYLDFKPGAKFSLSDNSRGADKGKSFVLVDVYTEFNSNLGFGHGSVADFRNEFRCIPSSTTYRPPRSTYKPVVEGPQTAIVATDGQEIVVDEHARVKVQFHWDRYGKKDVNSSCWIRVSQHHAGKGWGMIDIPRQHEEVIVSFLDGDPDRPIITGRVYNGDNQPPFGLKGAGDNAKNKTRRGNTTKTYEGEGYNEMTMDDTQGEEQIRIHAQYNMDAVVENDETLHVKNDRTKDVDNDETMKIGNNQTLTVVNDKTVTVKNNHTESVMSDQTITILGNRTKTVNQSETNTITSNQNNSVGANQTNMIGGAQATTVGGNYTFTVGSAVTSSIGAKKSETVSSKAESMVGMNSEEQVGMSKKTVAGMNNEVQAGQSIKLMAGMQVTIQAGASLRLQCGASMIDMNPGMVTITAPLVKLNC